MLRTVAHGTTTTNNRSDMSSTQDNHRSRGGTTTTTTTTTTTATTHRTQARQPAGDCEGLSGAIGDFQDNVNASTSSPQLSAGRTQASSFLTNHQRNGQSSTTTHHIASGVKLDLLPQHTVARQELLRDAFFPNWKDDASSADLDHPDEMQKKDPLATQIWKLYSKTKTQLPNHERMENLTWRMMAMSLKRKEREQAR